MPVFAKKRLIYLNVSADELISFLPVDITITDIIMSGYTGPVHRELNIFTNIRDRQQGYQGCCLDGYLVEQAENETIKQISVTVDSDEEIVKRSFQMLPRSVFPELERSLKEHLLNRIENQNYVIDELKAEYVRRMFDAAQNRTGYSALIREMDERGIRGRYGKPIKYTQIYEILHNYKYTGAYVYTPTKEKSRANQRSRKNAIVVEGAVPAIISKEQFEEVQKIMESRKHTGRKAGYLCSGLVYCSCGAKMHGITAKNNSGREYPYYVCSKKCGQLNVPMENVHTAATRYLQDLLSPHNQKKISDALRLYQSGEQNRIEAFWGALQRKIDEKQKQYDVLMSNLSAGTLPPAIVQDMGQRMQTLQDEIEALRDTPPPEDYTTDQITAWLESLKAAPDEKAIRLLIERIDVKSKTDFSIESTLKSILGNIGAANSIPKLSRRR